jgi:hypothetical protein
MKITMNVINKIKFLCGNAVPSDIVNGIDNAVARETTPRMPAQPITRGPFQPGDCSFLTDLNSHLGTKAAG